MCLKLRPPEQTMRFEEKKNREGIQESQKEGVREREKLKKLEKWALPSRL